MGWGESAISRKRFEIRMLMVLGVLLMLYWTPIIGWLSSKGTLSWPRDLWALDDILPVVGVYYAAIGGAALMLSVFTLVHAPVVFVRHPGIRFFCIGRFLIALLSLVSLAVGAFALGIAMFNPG